MKTVASPSSLYALFKYWNITMSHWSLLQDKQAQFPQPFFIVEMLQPSDHLSGPPLDLFQKLCVFLMLRAPGLDAVLQVGSHKS